MALSSAQQRDRRDILNFLKARTAEARNDLAVGELLLRSFTETYSNKMPGVATNSDRKADLLDVATRRKEGAVIVIELGYRIVGTFALIKAGSRTSQSWVNGAVNLRCLAVDPEFHGYGFSEVLVAEAERLARLWKAPCICLHVQQGAEGVARLYSRHGYIRDESGDMLNCGNRTEAYYLRLEAHLTVSDRFL